MRHYGSIPKGRGIDIQVQRSEFRVKPRIDIRTHYEFRPGDPDSVRPTKKGINIPVRHLPRLLAALKAAESDCLGAGLLGLEDYEEAEGLEPPAGVPA